MASAYKFIDHTADIAVEVLGSTYEELFLAALEGWKNSISDEVESKIAAENRVVDLEEDSVEELLVSFLREFNYLFDSKKIFPLNVNEVKIVESNTTFQLNSRISFCKISDTDIIKNEIKAVTFHQLDIKNEGGMFKTIIVFDI